MSATIAARASGVGSVHPEKVPGAFFDALIEMTGDSSYPADGYPFGIAQLQTLFGGAYSAIESIEVVNPWFSAASDNIFIAAYSKDEGTVQAFCQAVAGGSTPLAEITATTNLTAYTCTLRVRFF